MDSIIPYIVSDQLLHQRILSKLLAARSPAFERALVDALMGDIKIGSGQGERNISLKSG